MNLIDTLLAAIQPLPDKAFTGKWDYSGWHRLEEYIQDRRKKALAPIEARQATARERARQNEKDLEDKILRWYNRGTGQAVLKPGTRVKFKGTRDDGYRKIHLLNAGQVIGFQFYYQGHQLVDETTTTSNHVTNLRQVLICGEWVKIKDLL